MKKEVTQVTIPIGKQIMKWLPLQSIPALFLLFSCNELHTLDTVALFLYWAMFVSLCFITSYFSLYGLIFYVVRKLDSLFHENPNNQHENIQ